MKHWVLLQEVQPVSQFAIEILRFETPQNLVVVDKGKVVSNFTSIVEVVWVVLKSILAILSFLELSPQKFAFPSV